MKNGGCVIVGAGHGAAQLCASLRNDGWDDAITLIGDEPVLPYHRPPLSKAALKPGADGAPRLIRPEAFYRDMAVDTRLGQGVTSVDPARKTVSFGDETIAYDSLVLSLGSVHRLPPIRGIDGDRVFCLRTIADSADLRGSLPSARRVAIVGAGFIGLEVAASLRSQGLEVVVFELADRPLARVTSPVVSDYFARLHCDKGVDLRLKVQVSEVEKGASGLRIITADGEATNADLVVLGTGAAANVALAAAAGLAVGDGIKVDAYNRTSDPNIFAIGDCCAQIHPYYGRRLRLESVQNAVDQAKTASLAIVGKEKPHVAIPWFWSDQYQVKYQIAGISTGFDRVVLRGAPTRDDGFSAWHFAGEKLLAVDAVNDPRSYAVGLRVLSAGKTLDPAQVANLALSAKELLQSARSPEHACTS